MIETDVPGSGEAGWPTGFVRVETTGRSIVVFESSVTDPAAVLASAAGLGNVANSRDFQDQAVDVDGTDAGGAIYFAELGVAVVSADEDQVHLLRTGVLGPGGGHLRFARAGVPRPRRRPGLCPGLSRWRHRSHGRLGATEAGARAAASAAAAPPFADTAQFTWGLQATGVPSSPYSGKGVKVAVLDTGFDSGHPDFAGRRVSRSRSSPGSRRRTATATAPTASARRAGRDPDDRPSVRHRLRGGHLRGQSAEQRRIRSDAGSSRASIGPCPTSAT